MQSRSSMKTSFSEDFEAFKWELLHVVQKKSSGRKVIIAGSLEAAYSLNWGAQEIWGKGGGETLALL